LLAFAEFITGKPFPELVLRLAQLKCKGCRKFDYNNVKELHQSSEFNLVIEGHIFNLRTSDKYISRIHIAGTCKISETLLSSSWGIEKLPLLAPFITTSLRAADAEEPPYFGTWQKCTLKRLAFAAIILLLMS